MSKKSGSTTLNSMVLRGLAEAGKRIRNNPDDKMLVWVGIDPGLKGAVAIIAENGTVEVLDWSNVQDMYTHLKMLDTQCCLQLVVLEKVSVQKSDGAKSATTFQQHVGMWKAILDLLKLPWVEVMPQRWMMGRLPRKSGPNDKPSVPYVQARYPDVSLIGPRGGVKDGRADALCIAEFAKETALHKAAQFVEGS